MTMDTNLLPVQRDQVQERTRISQVYGWMGLALVVTGFVAMFTASNERLLLFIFSNAPVFWGLLIAEVLLVVYLSRVAATLSPAVATTTFLGYAAVNGLTLSMIFLVYTLTSIASTFFVTALTFGAMSIYGYTTKKDLTGIGNLALMALVGVIIATVVNMFLNSDTVAWIVSYLGVVIFIGLTAYDTQRIKRLIGQGGNNAAILGALVLYLDFVNMFLYLLRLFGRRRN
jgi:uncharacterized protein